MSHILDSWLVNNQYQLYRTDFASVKPRHLFVSREEQGSHFKWRLWGTTCFSCKHETRMRVNYHLFQPRSRQQDGTFERQHPPSANVMSFTIQGRQLAGLSQCRWRDDTRVKPKCHKTPLHRIISTLKKRRVWQEVESFLILECWGCKKIKGRREEKLEFIRSQLNTKINCSKCKKCSFNVPRALALMHWFIDTL